MQGMKQCVIYEVSHIVIQMQDKEVGWTTHNMTNEPI